MTRLLVVALVMASGILAAVVSLQPQASAQRAALTLPNPGDFTVFLGSPFNSGALPAAKPAGGTFFYEARNLPTGLSFYPTSREIRGTPIAIGSWSVVYEVTDDPIDPTRGFASTTFTIKVVQPPTPTPTPIPTSVPLPEVTITGDPTSITEGQMALFTLESDPSVVDGFTVNIRVTEKGSFVRDFPTSVSFGSNKDMFSLSIKTNDDDENETDGSVKVEVLAGSTYTVGIPGEATVSIRDNDPLASVTRISNAVNEGEAAQFRVELSRAQLTTVTVQLSATRSGGPLLSNPPSSVSFAAGETQKNVSVQTLEDTFAGADGTVTLSILTPSLSGGYVVGTPSSAEVGVSDNEPTVWITAATSTVQEGKKASYVVRLSEQQTRDVAVSIDVEQSGSYLSSTAPTSVTFMAGSTLYSLELQTFEDSVDKADGTIKVTIENEDDYHVGFPSSAQVDYRDNDPPTVWVRHEGPGSAFFEGSSAGFQVVLGRAQITATTITVSATATRATISGPTVITVVVPAGYTVWNFSVGTSADGIDQEDGTITATLVAGSDYTIVSPTSASMTMVDTDLPYASISSNQASVVEGNAALWTVRIPRVQTIDTPVNISVSDPDGFIDDTTPTPTSVTIPRDQTSATLRIPTDDDSRDEPNGEITVTLGSGSLYRLISPAPSASVTVQDNDEPPPATPAISITAVDLSVTEASPARFRLRVVPAQTGELTVTVGVVQTGEFLTDTAPTRTWRVPANTEETTFEIATADDEVDEKNGTITVTVIDKDHYNLGSLVVAAVAVLDDDDPITVSIARAADQDAIVDEGATLEFTVTASRASPSKLTVTIGLGQMGGPFLHSTDDTTATIEANQTEGTLQVFTDDDGMTEPDGSVTVTVKADTGYQVGSPASASVDILDNDLLPLPVVSIAPVDLKVTEASPAGFRLRVAPAQTGELTVTVGVVQTGEFLTDTAPTRTWRVPANTEETTFEIATADDKVDEKNGTITVTVMDKDHYNLGSPVVAAVAVLDDDDPVVSVALHNSTTSPLPEGSNALFEVQSSAPAPTGGLTVNYRVTESQTFLSSTTPAGNRSVTIASGASSAQVLLSTRNDNADEPHGTITVRVLAGTGYDVSAAADRIALVHVEDVSNPATPTNLRVNGHGGRATLRWDAAPHVTRYHVQHAEETCTPSGSCSSGAWSAPFVVDHATTAAITLPSPQSYRFEVQAVQERTAVPDDTSGWSAYAFGYVSSSRVDRNTEVLTAPFHGWLPAKSNGSHDFNYVVCTGTFPAGLITTAKAKMEAAVETWEDAVRWDVGGGSNIITASAVSATGDPVCDLDHDFPSAGRYEVKFTTNLRMLTYCDKGKYALYLLALASSNSGVVIEPPQATAGCWRSDSWAELLSSDIAPITSGSIWLNEGRGADWWNTLRSTYGCRRLENYMVHETGHAFGIGNDDLSELLNHHPENDTLSIMSYDSQFSHCAPQVYDVVAIMALYQSR